MNSTFPSLFPSSSLPLNLFKFAGRGYSSIQKRYSSRNLSSFASVMSADRRLCWVLVACLSTFLTQPSAMTSCKMSLFSRFTPSPGKALFSSKCGFIEQVSTRTTNNGCYSLRFNLLRQPPSQRRNLWVATKHVNTTFRKSWPPSSTTISASALRKNKTRMTFRRNSHNNSNNTSHKKKSVPSSTAAGAGAGAASSSTPKTTTIIWPKSIHDFCIKGTPITFQISQARTFQLDFGTLMLNFGAITSLSGFMMTDVLYLRSLSIVGSISGVIYNVSRSPPQTNAVAWGAVFIVVNTVQIIRLILERQEIKFTVEEAELFYKHFEPFGVEAKTFKELMQKLAHWKSYEAGKIIVSDGKPLGKVLVLVDGKATAHKVVPVEPSLTTGEDNHNFDQRKETKKTPILGHTTTKALYSYSSGQNGKIIGATGLIDPDLLGRNYPNRIVTDTKTRLLSFDTKKLCEFLVSHDASMEAAIFHMMYVDLVGSLRRHRTLSGVGQGIGMAVHDLKIMLQQACADGIIHPAERRLIRQFMEKHSMDDSQLYALLESDDVGWTKDEWKDGAKLEVLKEQQQTEQELGKLMQHVLSDIK